MSRSRDAVVSEAVRTRVAKFLTENLGGVYRRPRLAVSHVCPSHDDVKADPERLGAECTIVGMQYGPPPLAPLVLVNHRCGSTIGVSEEQWERALATRAGRRAA